MKYYITIGLVGSGKSMWAKKLAKDEKVVIINRDSIRTMIKGGYVYNPDYEEFVKSAVTNLLSLALIHKFDVIIDETNVTKRHRKHWVDAIRFLEPNADIIFAYFPEVENNLKNRMQDPKGISEEQWAKVIEGMKNIYEPIEKEEGYDTLTEWKIK